MKNYFYTRILCVLVPLFVYTQSDFKKGLVVKSNNQIIECYIDNKDWAYNPTKIKYKININEDQVIEEDLATILSFEIYDISKYVKFKLKIDNSSNRIDNYSYSKEPEYIERTFFAKEIVFGDLSLYEYNDEGYIKYIIQNKEGVREQLIYKTFKVDDRDKITPKNDSRKQLYAINNDYKKQLGRFLKCRTLDLTILQTLKYEEEDLKEIIIKNNICLDPNYVPAKRIKLKGDLNINVLAKSNLTNFELEDLRYGIYEFDKHNSLGAGIEIEYVFPINNFRWALISECSYNQFKSNAELKLNQYNTDFVDVAFNNLDVSLGVRYYLFSEKNLKGYVNISTFFNTPIGDSYVYRALFYDINLIGSRGNNYSYGVGTKLFNNFIFECRYLTYARVGIEGPGLISQSNVLSFILGYSFF